MRGVSLRLVDGTLEDLPRHFREALRADPVGAYRDWFRAQEELRERGEAGIARTLADDLWELVPQLSFGAAEERARFLHNAAVFFGSPGPAADLGRARQAFAAALDHFSAHAEDGWHARALHNLATSLSNLGAAAPELEEAVILFERALEWRTAEREIARGVTLHNLGLALRRLAELDPALAVDHLARSAGCLRDAIAIRERNRLAEGRAASERHLGLTLDRLEAARREKR